MKNNRIPDFNEIKEVFINKKAWGISTSLDLYDCDPEIIQDAEAIRKYIIELCDNQISVTRYGEPVIVRFGKDPKVTGYSLSQLIESSLVSGHFAETSNVAYLDVFSCDAYDPQIIINFSKFFFKAKDFNVNVIYRK
ncbi:MAG: S-adenosylmethionine decarboxylase [Patescibacteria group bacterium]